MYIKPPFLGLDVILNLILTLSAKMEHKLGISLSITLLLLALLWLLPYNDDIKKLINKNDFTFF
ncbi:MAG: hypothetical protein AB1765_10075 [Candidatus Hydrogenedentota bacterium]